jgi:hypothetical protein
MGLISLPIAAAVVAMSVWISTFGAVFMGLATVIVTAMSAFIAFLLVLI